MAPRFRTLDFRTVDGSNNNLADPAMNQADTDFARVGPAHFADGFNEMTPGPNPREISNIVVAQADTGEDAHRKASAESEQYAANNGFEVFSEREGYRQDDEPLIDGYEVWSALFEARQSLAEFYAARYAAYKYHPDP